MPEKNYAAPRGPLPVVVQGATQRDRSSPGTAYLHPGRSEMSSKREDRKQRAEAERLEREHAKRAQRMRTRAFLVAGVLVVALIVVLGITRRREQPGRVWSAEHGHWHDK